MTDSEEEHLISAIILLLTCTRKYELSAKESMTVLAAASHVVLDQAKSQLKQEDLHGIISDSEDLANTILDLIDKTEALLDGPAH